ncbi:MAG: hypothetical protein AAF985_17370, partial [Bacteroidota bacterium]
AAQELALFQYLIGNTDWQIPFMHNVKIFKKEEQTAPIVVPYDFDCSGLVNTDYARVNPDFKQKEVRERIFMGVNNTHLEASIALFQSKEEAIVSMIKDFDLLDKKVRKDVLKYVNSFYRILNSKKEVKAALQPLKHDFY